MRYVQEFVNKKILCFVEVGSHDEHELLESGTQSCKNLSLELDALPCLRFFPHVENLILRPGEIRKEELSYLQGLRIRTLKLDYYSEKVDLYTIDLAQFPNLQFVFSCSQYNFKNIAACKTLCTLVVREWYDDNLHYLLNSDLYAISILKGNLKTLDGIQTIPGLRSVLLANQRLLTDVHSLMACNELESLSFEKCNQVNFTQIPELPNLCYLKLIGSQKVDSLSFLTKFPKIAFLLLFDLTILDGNLDVLLRLRHCTVIPNRRNYSVSDKDLPQSQRKFCSAVIPPEFEILPEETVPY